MFVKLLLVLRRVFCWLSIAELPACIALEVSRISDFISSNILVILSTDCFEFSASFLTSPATTEKPLPASPALAASIAAFKESKFVWLAIWLIESVIVFTDSSFDTREFTVELTIVKACCRDFNDSSKSVNVFKPASATWSVSKTAIWTLVTL